jgi:hypothetical protein
MVTLLILCAVDSLVEDRTFSVLAAGTSQRQALDQAGDLLGAWTIQLGGHDLDGPRLKALAAAQPEKPLARALRDALARPIDAEDFLYFLDDVLAQAERGQVLFVANGRARNAGIFLHPQEVFEGRPRLYGSQRLAVDVPAVQSGLPPAADGDVLGPNWSTRYLNPEDEAARLADLRAHAPSFADRAEALILQLRSQGAEVYVSSAVRSRHRGYLMWGAFLLSEQASAKDMQQAVRRLQDRNRRWGVRTKIRWRHPGGWRATREAARLMKDAYDVVLRPKMGRGTVTTTAARRST